MRNRIQIYRILWKQYLLKHRLWIVFLLALAILVGTLGKIHASAQEEYQGIAVGVCWEDEKGEELMEKLEEAEGIFRFHCYNDEEEMIRQVENGTLECGYLLPSDFYDNLLKRKSKRKITLYYSPASSVHKISYEIVFSNLFEILSEDILKEYLREIGDIDDEETQERLLLLNRQYAEDGSTFHFEYETIESGGSKTSQNINTFKGCLAVMMFLMSLLGLGNVMEQEKTWKALPGRLGKKMKSRGIHVAVLGSILIGGICILASDILEGKTGWGKELAALLIYFIVLEIYIRILSLFIKNSRILYGLLPVLILGSCLFCPVFIRIANYLPSTAWISKLFPVSYYLDI